MCGPQIISGDIKLATDTHRPTQTFCLLDLSEQKISSLCDIKHYLTEKNDREIIGRIEKEIVAITKTNNH